jgi:hypothetical protein
MKKRFLLAGSLVLFLTLSALAQDVNSLKYANTITEKDLEKHLTYLASDEMEGRDTGEKGQKMAAAYLENFYKVLGHLE